MTGLPAETDFVVIGAGIAGLRAAIELAPAGRVLVLAKDSAPSSSPDFAPLSDEEEVILHLQDTLIAGDGLCNPEAVTILEREAVQRFEELLIWGRHLEKNKSNLIFESEARYKHSHVLRAPGASASAEVSRVLRAKARATKNITVLESKFCTDLLTDGGRVVGVSLLDEKGSPEHVSASAVLLSTGGLGQIFRNTTNSEAATADGVAMASRAGAEIGDMEFIQFHPTTLYMRKAPRFVLSEELRSEGAYLRNVEMDRFMGKYHSRAEMAPADVVARAIMHEMEVSRARDPFVYLDLTHLDAAKVRNRFPRIYEICMKHNIDITEDVIPVRPAAHCAIGGVRTNLDSKTSIDGLYAAGEMASTGVHGANRFPSNSLPEALVFGARAGYAMREEIKTLRRSAVHDERAASQNGPVDAGIEQLIGQIQDAMWKGAGIVRTRAGMQEAVKVLEGLNARVAHTRTRRSREAANLHLAATLVARSALAREESRGAHYRTDYPAHDDKNFLKHSVVTAAGVKFV